MKVASETGLGEGAVEGLGLGDVPGGGSTRNKNSEVTLAGCVGNSESSSGRW